MNTEDRRQTLRISVDELEQASPAPRRTLRPRASSYGNVSEATAPKAKPRRGSFFLRTWCYLGLAGMAGALTGWALTEPGYSDGLGDKWGNIWLMPLVVGLMCAGFAIAESLIERSPTKALNRGALSLALGTICGFLLDRAGDVIYNFLLGLSGAQNLKADSVSVWLARGAGWAVVGIAGGVIYGVVGRSVKKGAYGVLGGVLGAAVGGTLFDPLSLVTHGAAASRAVGFGILGLATGSAMGLVESVLKDRWLYVTAGPLAGKQFILYKTQTVIGSNKNSDIYLFKDPDIESQHAFLELRGSKMHLDAIGPVLVCGEPVSGDQTLENGAEMQVGRYCFRYQEKER